MDSETTLENVASNQEVTNQEDIRTQLLKCEQQKEKLRTNLKKLKEKMIDTNMMQAEVKLEEERKEKTNLRLQLEQVLQETQPLRDKLSQASDKNISLQSSLDKVQAQLRSTVVGSVILKLFTCKAYNSQLKAEVESRASSKDEMEALKKECKSLKKELLSKTNRVSVLEADLSTLKRQLEEKKKEVAMLEDRNKEIQLNAEPIAEAMKSPSEKAKEKRKKKPPEAENEKSKKRKVKKDEDMAVVPIINKFEAVMSDTPYPVPFTEIIGVDINASDDSDIENQITEMVQQHLEYESEHDEIEVSLGAPIPCPVKPHHARKQSEGLFEYIVRQVSHLEDGNFDDTLIAITEELAKHSDMIHTLADGFVVAIKTRPRKDLLPDDDLIHCLLWYMLESLPSMKQNALDYMLQHLGSLILTAPDEQIEETIPLCSLFASLCKFGGDIERVRVLLYDVLRERPFMEIWTVTAIASVWPQCLNYQGGNSILLKTIESIVTFFCQDLQPSDSKELKIYQSLKSICQWQLNPSSVSFENLVDEAVKIITMEGQVKDKVHNAVKSLELIASNQGWPWCYNTIVVGQLWPLMQPGKFPQNAMLTAVRLFGILGRTVISSMKSDGGIDTSMLQSAANMDGIVLLRNRLEMILSRQVIQFSVDVEMMAALSLIDLSFGLPQHLTKVKSWAAGLTNEQRNGMGENLQKVLTLIQ